MESMTKNKNSSLLSAAFCNQVSADNVLKQIAGLHHSILIKTMYD